MLFKRVDVSPFFVLKVLVVCWLGSLFRMEPIRDIVVGTSLSKSYKVAASPRLGGAPDLC